MTEDLERQIETLIEKSIAHSEILEKIQRLLKKIVNDLYGEDIDKIDYVV